MATNLEVTMRLDVRVPMRDGVDLSADIYLPQADGPFPVVLMRTPYSNNVDSVITKARRLANRGYACVVQDVRGRWDSGGEYYAFHQEIDDGFDTQEWVGQQDWCDGNIGMSGASYGGCVQWLSAPLRNKYLKAMVPRVMCTDYYRGLMHPGGAFQLNVMMTWGMRTNGRTGQSIDYHNWTEAFRSLPLTDLAGNTGRDLEFWKDWLAHPEDDEYWNRVNTERRFSEIEVPALIMGGWYDLYATDTFANFKGLRENGGSVAARGSKLIVGPWPHALATSTKTGDIDFGVASLLDLESIELNWFDRWLKRLDTGPEDAPIRLFVMGANRWREENEWPLARTDWQAWQLHSEGSANTARGDGTLSLDVPGVEASDSFIYDPEMPVQTIGGNNCCSPDIVPWGPYDQRPAEARHDVLCYTSEVLSEDLEVTGPVRLELFAATDGLDTDWTAKLVDVSPSGYAKNLCDGIIRARYRSGFDKAILLEPGNVYEYEISVGVTSNVFKKGHRIRLEVSSSNFPRFDRNLNTGGQLYTETDMRVARQTIYHSGDYPSQLILPVINT
ncbi:MAG: CocE/NonD family hydrolase [Chloroflexi bacterium]|nr:CocE/NonD family hydrolase [Chloroflexota bacterium]